MPLYENGKEVLGNLTDYPEQRPRFASSVSCLSQKVKVDLDTSASPKTIIDTSAYKVKLLSFRIDVAAKIHVPIRLSAWSGLNGRPDRPKRPALPTALHAVRSVGELNSYLKIDNLTC